MDNTEAVGSRYPKIYNFKQRTEEWIKKRRAHFTASDFDTLMPSTRQKIDDFNDTQMKIIYRVASERMTDCASPSSYISQAMQWGMDYEDEARAFYEMETGNKVDKVGFVELSEWIGCSPDGLIRDDGYWEAKCPNSDTHLKYFKEPHKIEEDYGWQVIGGLLVTGRSWGHLISYDPRFIDSKKQLVVWSIEKDAEKEEKIYNRLCVAIAKAQEVIDG